MIDINTLQIETTNICNLNCPHCMLYEHGESGSDYSDYMETKSINQFFDKDMQIIYTLNFTGGEPLLNADIIIYTINKIIRENRKVVSIDIATNGTILSAELIKALNRFTEYVTEKVLKNSTDFLESYFEKDSERLVNLRISKLYHKNDYEKAYQFYRERANRLVHVEIIDDKSYSVLAYSGRAKKIDSDFFCDSPHHKIIYADNQKNTPLVKCPLKLMSNGDIGISCYCTIKEAHKNAIGNISENISLLDMITRWNYQAPLTCDEACKLAELKMFYEQRRVDDISRILNTEVTIQNLDEIVAKEEMKCALLENFRRLLHERILCLTPDEIERISHYWYDVQVQAANKKLSEGEVKKANEKIDNYIADLIVAHAYEGVTRSGHSARQ